MSYYEVQTGIPPSALMALYQKQSYADRYGGCCMCAGSEGGSMGELRRFSSDLLAKGYTPSQALGEYRRLQMKGGTIEMPMAFDRSGTVNSPPIMYQLPWAQSFNDTAASDAAARELYVQQWRRASLSQNRGM